jgi:hypothetical protein
VLLFTPGRAAAQGLAGWPARVDVSLASSPTNIGGSQSTVSGTDEQEDKYQSGEEGGGGEVPLSSMLYAAV